MNRIIVIVISMIFLVSCAHFQTASLLKSSSTGNLTEIKAYIQSGANINEQDSSYRRTPLMNAIANHKIEAAKYLIQAGANVTLKDSYGYDALMLAAEMQNDGLEVIKMLLEKGADINSKDLSGSTPLMHAIANNKMDAAKYLIQAGANVTLKDSSGYDALIIAVENGNNGLEVINMLLDKGADINSKDQSGWTPLMHTLRVYNSLHNAHLLIKRGADLQVRDPETSKSLEDLALYYKQPGLAAEFKEAMANNGSIKYDAKIVFIRESSPLMIGRMIGSYNIEIAVDGRTINMNMKESSSDYIEISSGKHEIMIKGSFYEGSHKISLDAKPGETYYFELHQRVGNVAATMVGGIIGGAIEASVKGDKAGPIEIIQLEESQAKEKMKTLKINR